MKLINRKAILTCLAFYFSLVVASQDKTTSKAIEPILSADESILNKIKELPDNTWLKLPPIKVVGDLDWCKSFNWESIKTRGPYGRDYSSKAAWMPDRKRAIFAGGGHNIMPYNDVWEYDLASNTWVCLYGSDVPAQGQKAEWIKENLIIQNGALQTKRGGPPRLSHTFDGWSYDSDQKLAFMPESLRGAVFVDSKVVAAGLGITDAELNLQWKPAPYFLTFDPYSRKWNYLTENIPKCGRDPSAKYISHLKSWWVNSGGNMGLYDPKTQTTKKLNLKDGGGGYSSSAVYDPETKSMVTIFSVNKEGVSKTLVYSFETDSWKTALSTAPTGGCSATGYFDYDSASKQFVLYTNTPNPSFWIYNLQANEWTKIEIAGEQPTGGYVIGYYDPERDVLVHYNSKDVYVCRLKLPKKQ